MPFYDITSMGKAEVTYDGSQWSNADDDRVALSAYDPAWPGIYAEEAGVIRHAIGDEIAFEIEHFGSTAVVGLAAKPVIDIMLIPGDRRDWSRLIAPLEALEYVYWAANPRTDRMFFVKGMPPYGDRRTHHVHVRTPDDAAVALLFRNYLRTHPDKAQWYEQIKRTLAMKYPTDREAYTEAKAACISEIVKRARAENAG